MKGRRLAFWGTVAVVSVGANFLFELLADAVPSVGLKQLAAYTHKGLG